MGDELHNSNDFDSILREGLKAHLVKAQVDFDLRVLNQIKKPVMISEKWRLHIVDLVLTGLILTACITIVLVLLLIPNSISAVMNNLLKLEVDYGFIQAFFFIGDPKIIAVLLIVLVYFLYDEQVIER